MALPFDSKKITELLSKATNKKFSNEAKDLVALVNFADSGIPDPSAQQVCDVLANYDKRYNKLLNKIEIALNEYSIRQYLIMDNDGLISIIICPWKTDPKMVPIIKDDSLIKPKGYCINIQRNPFLARVLQVQRN